MLLPKVSIVTTPLIVATHLYQSVAPQIILGWPPPNWKVGSPCCVVASVLLPATLAGVLRAKRLSKLLLASGSVTNVTVLTAEVPRRPRLSVATAVKACTPAAGLASEPA